jgi:hypothetical protein
MQARRTVFAGLVVVLAVLAVTHVLGQIGPPSTEMLGYGVGPDGKPFAILKGYGVVTVGHTIPMNTPKASYKLKVVAISPGRVDMDVIDFVLKHKEPPKPPPEVKPEPRRPLAPRDPFCPVGYGDWAEKKG